MKTRFYRIADYVHRMFMLMVILAFLVVKAASFTGFYHLPVEFFIMVGIPSLTLILLTTLQLTQTRGLARILQSILCIVLVLIVLGFLVYLVYTVTISPTLVVSSGFGILILLFMIPLFMTSIIVVTGIIKGKI